jgi:arylsulfatase A-like enzyme
VLPEMMTEASLEARETYPNKRLIFHYVQPHHPFIESDIDFGIGEIDREPTEDERSLDRLHGWMQLLTGQATVSLEEVAQAYHNNLDRALPHVVELVDALDGTTVITSDHGNMLGERVWPFMLREYGHPPGIYTKQLVEVPWFELSSSSRRIISANPPQEADRPTVEEEVVSERLSDLGYM